MPMAVQRSASTASFQVDQHSGTSEVPAARLGRRSLLLARLAWLLAAISVLGVFVVSLPAHYDQLLHNTGPQQVSAEFRNAELRVLGLSARNYAAYLFVLEVLLPF